ncbi:Phosphotransferase system, HPr [Mesobacillus persicus]|uniref:Phosphotransferase system, HPr n=1 Tax=Mesobacillus persicus TaxID=930146 RepID=A0A1H8DUU1_9BACI|nr:HPr family phosphocarrier protein [Mesobacillus persicus]SEN11071.1 Phosphotransferase system, HPr [Mesobacillus persicus]
MNGIISSSVVVRNRFSFRKMLEIHQAVKKYNGTLYLSSQQKVVDASSLTKLVSFLLTVEQQTSLKIILEGNDTETHLEQFRRMLANETSIVNRNLIESSDSFQM